MPETTSPTASPPPRQENAFLNLICNIFLPIFILNKLTSSLGAVPALFLALAFPLGYGLWDLWRRKKTNMFSLLGLINIGVTGTFALSHLDGPWFSLKEAAFPLLIGTFVFFSAHTERPFVETLFLNANLFRMDLIRERIASLGRQPEFRQLLKTSTRWLSMSFLVSAALNFVLASRIFSSLPETLNEVERSEALNAQIAEMTKWSMMVILIPSVAFLMGIFYHLLKGLRRLTGLTDEELMKAN